METNPMLKSRRFSLWFIALVLLATSILPHHVSASGITYREYNWIIAFEFNSAPPQGNLRVVVRTHYADGTVQEQGFDNFFTCSKEGPGTVTIAGGKATFQNGGYLSCDLPNIRTTVRDYVSNAVLSEYYDPFWVQVVSTIKTSVGTADNPVVWHPDLNVGLPYTSGPNTAAIAIETADYSTVSSSFTPLANHSVLVNERNWLVENNQPNCSAAFRQNGNPLSVATYNCPRNDAAMHFSSAATTIYVGYSADTGATFNGTIDSLKIDPQWGVLD
jgi:hypothetical protein